MSPPEEVESEEHLRRLVQEHANVIAGFSPDSTDGNDSDQQQRAFEELAKGNNSSTSSRAALCRTRSLSTIAAAELPLPDAAAAAAGRGESHREPWWFFFRGGKMVYAAPGGSSTPVPKLLRLAALLERSPDTLDQLARQDQVSLRQKREQHDTAAAAAAAMDQERAENPLSPLQQEQRGQGQQQVRAEIGAGREAGEGMLPPGAGAAGGAAVSGPAALIFVAGDRSQVGKSSTCLGLLGTLLRQQGLHSSDLAYIKPATQCERPQLVTDWCEANGVACRGIGPVVFYKGFTREFLKGGAGTPKDLLQEIRDAVEEISVGKKVVVVDGVGYPAVGSICGVSNGEVAACLGAPVLLVGKSGVGDAVDSYNLNACFFEARGVRVLGGVFNRIPTTGYYSLDRCREAVTSYFSQANPNALPYGFVPEIASLKKAAGAGTAGASATAQATASNATAVAAAAAAASATMSTTTPTSTTAAVFPGVPAAGGTTPAAPGVGVGGSGGEKGEGSQTESTAETGRAPAAKREPAAVPPGEGSGAADEVAGTTPPQQQLLLPATEVESEEDLRAFSAAAGRGRLVVVDFGATWCKNCKAILPFVHGLPERFRGAVAVATADVDEAAELVDAHDVSTIPHFVLLRSGAEVGTYIGSSEAELLSMLTEHVLSVGVPQASPTPPGGDSGTTSAGSSGGGADDGSGGGGGEIDQSNNGGNQNGGQEESYRGTISPVALEAAKALIDAFDENVDVGRLLRDIREHAAAVACRSSSSADDPLRSPPPPPSLPLPLPRPPLTASPPSAGTTASTGDSTEEEPITAAAPTAIVTRGGGGEGVGDISGVSSPGENAAAATEPSPDESFKRKTREEVEAEAAKQGASGG